MHVEPRIVGILTSHQKRSSCLAIFRVHPHTGEPGFIHLVVAADGLGGSVADITASNIRAIQGEIPFSRIRKGLDIESDLPAGTCPEDKPGRVIFNICRSIAALFQASRLSDHIRVKIINIAPAVRKCRDNRIGAYRDGRPAVRGILCGKYGNTAAAQQ